MSIFLYMDALFGFVAPIAASKINVNDWSFRNFSQTFNIWIKHVFSCNIVRHVPGGYSKKLDKPIVHGWGVEACCPAFPVPEPMQEPSLRWQRQNTSRLNQKNCFHQNNVVRIVRSVPSLDMSTIKHVKEIFGQRVWRIILALRNLQALNAALQEESRLIHRYHSYLEYAKPVQVLICGWLGTLVTEGILIFQTQHLKLSH